MRNNVENNHYAFIIYLFIYFDFKNTFIKVGNRETRKCLGEKKQQESLDGLLWLTGKSEKRGPWGQG